MTISKERVFAVRKRKLDLTQPQFAQLLGVHPLTVSKWERGEATPTPHQAALIESFAAASTKNEDIGETVAGLLATAGIAFALFVLLEAAFGKKK